MDNNSMNMSTFVYTLSHTYLPWWADLAVFLVIIALLVKYYPTGDDDDDNDNDTATDI